MSKAKTRWKRVFGLPRNRWDGRDPALRPLPPDCKTVVTPPVLRQAGVKNVHRELQALERRPDFHRWTIVLPDGTVVEATHPTSLSWIVGVQRDEGLARRQANLMIGDQAPLETIVTKPQESKAPFVPKIWRVPRAPPATPAVPWNDRELDSALAESLYSDALRLLNATDAPPRRGDLAAELGLGHLKEDRLVLAKVLYRLKTEGHHVAP